MKPQSTLKIVIGYLAIVFALAFLFTSCEIQRDCPGAGRQNGFSGYSNQPAKAIYGPKRQRF
jgi:hypothetical protein